MCVVSIIMDHYGDEWGRRQRYPRTSPNWPDSGEADWEKIKEQMNKLVDLNPKPNPITSEEIQEFRRLLERAREYDKRNNEPNCEMEEKKQKLRDLAKELGIADKLAFLDEPEG